MERPSKASKVPRLVRTSTDEEEDQTRKIEQSVLLNRLNHLHFQDGSVLLTLEHTRRRHRLNLEAVPQPATGERIDCRWTEPSSLPQNLGDYRLQRVLIADGRRLTAFVPVHPGLSEHGASFLLPAAGSEIGDRQIRRHPCTGLGVQLCQNGAVFSGRLLDFNPAALRVELMPPPAGGADWLDPDAAVHLLIADPHGPLFAADCRLLRQSDSADNACFVLQPASSRLRRFPPREFRSIRQQLHPAPDIVFHHPLSGKVCHLPVVDLSGSGFAVEEEECRSVLLPGMILREVEISLASSCRFTCSAQVVYRLPEKDGRVRCGLAVLDMDQHDQGRLLGLLLQAQDHRATLGTRVDLDELWRLFFDSGFIYPEKYRALLANKEKFKATCRKFYSQDLPIARHFLYREGGRILGHIAMLRFYDRAWLIQHHAASRDTGKKAGLKVLGQISRYVNELHHLPAARLNHVFCWFRPENKFPSRLFGGVARHMDDPDGCALYPFAYLCARRPEAAVWELPPSWQLVKATDKDLEELRHFFAGTDGAMITAAFDLEPGRADSAEVCQEYGRIGCRREKRLFALKHAGTLTAFVLVDTADLGLNLSELTNAIKVIVLEPEGLPRDILETAIAQLRILFDEAEPSVLIYPQSYAEVQEIAHEKTYNLWILDLRYLDRYFHYCQKFLRDANIDPGIPAGGGKA